MFQNTKFTIRNKFNNRCLIMYFISRVSTLSGVLFYNIWFLRLEYLLIELNMFRLSFIIYVSKR